MPVTEEELSARVGLSRDRLRSVRRELRLVSPQDWSSERGRGIVYGDEACEAILAYLAGQCGENFSSDSMSPPSPAIVEVSVKRLLPADSRLLGEFEGRQVVIRVRPGKAALFVPGMTLLAAADEGALWDYRGGVGRPGAYPRSRGRW